MVTTRRASTEMSSSVFERSSTGGIDVLERKTATPRNDFVMNGAQEETIDQARARMRGNLDMLLNYDRYSEQVSDSAVAPVIDKPVVEESQEVVSEPVNLQDEDIRPTSTTMQFGDGDVDQMYKEMNREEHEVGGSYHLNAKGKLVVVLYALAVTVILALIIINTGILASLSGTKEAKMAELNSKIAQYEQLSANIDSISGDEYVMQQAEQLGMVKR